MSIQETIKNQESLRSLLFRTGTGRQIYRYWHRKEQVWHRLRTQCDPLVFFRYYSPHLTHPAFKRFYEFPPVPWSTKFHAKLNHWINYPDFIDHRPFIIEPNDHPLAPTGKSEPFDVVSNLVRAEEIYKHRMCKKIIVESEGQLQLFKHYFEEEVIKKTIILGALPAIPKKIDWQQKSFGKSRTRFLFLASDFVNKAVDLLLDAWLNVPERKEAELIVACSNVPQEWERKSYKENVLFIKKAPLTEIEKNELHQNTDIAIGLQHVDGGANMFEAMEWGLPIIVLRSQRHHGHLQNQNGLMIDVPFYFYDPEFYGTRWKTFKEFYQILEEAKNKGEFEKTKQDLRKALSYFINNPEKAVMMGKRSFDLTRETFSLEKRNETLLRIYYEALGPQPLNAKKKEL